MNLFNTLTSTCKALICKETLQQNKTTLIFGCRIFLLWNCWVITRYASWLYFNNNMLYFRIFIFPSQNISVHCPICAMLPIAA